MGRYFAGFCRIGKFSGPEAGGGLGWNGIRGMYAVELRGQAGRVFSWAVYFRHCEAGWDPIIPYRISGGGGIAHSLAAAERARLRKAGVDSGRWRDGGPGKPSNWKRC